MKKLTLFISIFCAILSCTNKQQNTSETANKLPEYPSIIDSYKLRELYDQTKWLMYCFQCDDTLITAKPGILGDSITFSILSLKYDTIQKFRDSLTEIKFNFYYKETEINDSFSRNIPIWRVVYSDATEKVIYYSMRSDLDIQMIAVLRELSAKVDF